MSAGPSQATVLIGLAVGAGLFHDSDGRGYAVIDVEDHRETWPIRSKGFRDWLARMFYLAEQKSANASAIQDALMTIEGQARYDGPEHVVHLRVAAHDDHVYIDLCDRHWRVIEISADGWKSWMNRPSSSFGRVACRRCPSPRAPATPACCGDS